MIIDGNKIAEEIKSGLAAEISGGGMKLSLDIVQVGNDPVSAKFIKRKENFAGDIGVETKLHNFPEEISTENLCRKIKEICDTKEKRGIIVQLPLPAHINTQDVLNVIPPEKDVDVLSAAATGYFTVGGDILPPVADAAKEILDRSDFKTKGKNAVVIGAGILVGKPSAIWLINQGASVSVLRSHTADIAKYTIEADIIISGVGKPGLIMPEMVKEGVIVIDAGTSFKNGKLAGDVCESVSKKASIFTPVPGGVGPLTVAMVFKNLIKLSKDRQIMNNLSIRRYKYSDKKIVWELHVNGINQTGTFVFNPELDSDLENIDDVYINNGGEFFVALLGGNVVGMGALKKIDGKTAEIKRMRVNPRYQRRGIGSEILKKLIKRAKLSGYERLILDSSVKRKAAHNLYEKYGFAEYKRDQKGDYGTIFFKLDLKGNQKDIILE